VAFAFGRVNLKAGIRDAGLGIPLITVVGLLLQLVGCLNRVLFSTLGTT